MVDIGTEVTRRAVLEHLDAFNNHDTAAVQRGLAADVVWATGTSLYRGRGGLAAVFDDWLWSLTPHLEVTRLIANGPEAALECIETMVVEGTHTAFSIAVFFVVRDGLLKSVKVYREGSADVTTSAG